MNKKIVIKIGSDVLTSGNSLNYERVISLAKEIDQINRLGYETLLVSSGAVASGAKKTQLKTRPKELVEKRALSAIGQCYLMEAWIKAFHPTLVAQILLTWQELADEESKLKIKETIFKILESNITPIINENDAIADEEIRFSDNDQLALKVARLVCAERIILLTDVDGLFTKNPKKHSDAQLIQKVTSMTDKIKSLADESGSSFGSGGMLSKVTVAEQAMDVGIVTNILNGKKDGLIVNLLRDGQNHGTEFRKRSSVRLK